MAQMDLSSIEQKISELTSLVKQSVGEDDEESPAKKGSPQSVSDLKEFVDYAHRQMVPVASQWRTRSKKVAGGVLTIDCAINSAWLPKASEASQLALILVKLVDICVAFASDQDASWISASTFRLLHVVLIRMTVPLLENSSHSTAEYASALQESSAVLSNVKGAGVGVAFVREVMDAMQHLLEDWKTDAGKAVVKVAVGVVKSFFTWKLDDELLQGLKKGLQAGTSYFKQMHGRKRLALMCEVSWGTTEGLNGRVLRDGVMRQLRSMTTKINQMKGNWVTEVTWVYELHRTASCALDVLASLEVRGAKERPELKREAEDCLEAVLHGGSRGVMGLTKMFEASKNPLSRHHGLVKTLVNGLLDGETLATVLRSALDETAGELKECLESGWEAKAKELTALFCSKSSDARREMGQKVAEMSAERIKRLQQNVAGAAVERAKTLEQLLAKAERHVANAIAHAQGMDAVLASMFEFRKFLFLHHLIGDDALNACVSECIAIWNSSPHTAVPAGAELELEVALEDCLASMSDRVKLLVSDMVLTDRLSQTVAELSPTILDQAISVLLAELSPIFDDASLSFYKLVTEFCNKDEVRQHAETAVELLRTALQTFALIADVAGFLRFAVALRRRMGPSLARNDREVLVDEVMERLVDEMESARSGLERLMTVLTSVTEAWSEGLKMIKSTTATAQEVVEAGVMSSIVWRVTAVRMPCGDWEPTVKSLQKVQDLLLSWQSEPELERQKLPSREFGKRGELQALLASAEKHMPEDLPSPDLREEVKWVRAELLKAATEPDLSQFRQQELVQGVVAHVERAYQKSALAGVLGSAHAGVRRLGKRLQGLDDEFKKGLAARLKDVQRSVAAMEVPQASKLLGNALHGALSAFVLVRVVQKEVTSARASMSSVAQALNDARQRVARVRNAAEWVQKWKLPNSVSSLLPGFKGKDAAKHELQEKLLQLSRDLEGLATVGELKVENGALVTDHVRGSRVDGVLQLAGRAAGAVQDTLLRASELFELQDDVGRAAHHVMSEVREHLRDQFEDMVGKVNHFTQTKLEQLSNTLTSWGPSLGNLYKMFDSKVSEETKGAAREIIKGVVGPPPKPEMVQEAALSALLELEPRVRGRTQGWAKGGRAESGLSDVHGRITRVFAMVRSTATAGPLKALMQQDKFRSVLRESVQTHWQEVKQEAMEAVQKRAQVQRELSGTLTRKEVAPNANFLTVAEKLARRQEQEAKAGLDSLSAVQADLQQVPGGAAGLSVELDDFVHDLAREVKRYTIVVEINLERLAGARGDYHFNYTYNFFNHIHTNKDVTVKNEIGETQTLQITRRRQRPWNINRAPMLALVQELEEVIGKQQRKRNVSVKDHFAVLRAWIAQKSEAWGLMTVNPDHLPVDPSHVEPTHLSGPKHRLERIRQGLMGRESGFGPVPIDLSGQRRAGTRLERSLRWDDEGSRDDEDEDEDEGDGEGGEAVFGESSGVSLEQRNALLQKKVEAQREEIKRLKQELQAAQRRGPTSHSLRASTDLAASSPTASRSRPSSAGPRLTLTAARRTGGNTLSLSSSLNRTSPAAMTAPTSPSRTNPNAPSTPSWSRTHIDMPSPYS